MVFVHKEKNKLIVESLIGDKGKRDPVCSNFIDDYSITSGISYFQDDRIYFDDNNPEKFIDNMHANHINHYLWLSEFLGLNLDSEYQMDKLKAYFNVNDKSVCENLVNSDFKLFDLWCKKYDDAFKRKLIESYDLYEVKSYKEELSRKGLWMSGMDVLLELEPRASKNTEVMKLIKIYKDKIM